ncbi:MAG: hypothetical protein QOE55_4809 [Acidobacteriaceae bacterium]|nr:hypothetical protein [Acidobacteriaceae bacterium]
MVNIIVLWNTLYIDLALQQLRAEGFPVFPEDEYDLRARVPEDCKSHQVTPRAVKA